MDETNNDQMNMGGGQKKGSGALVGSVIIIIIIIIAGIYMFKNANTENGDAMMQEDSVVEELGEQADGDDLLDIESDLNDTNLDDVVPATEEAVQ